MERKNKEIFYGILEISQDKIWPTITQPKDCPKISRYYSETFEWSY